MLVRNSTLCIAALVLSCAAPVFGETAGTVSSLAALFSQDAATPRQGASVPISVHNGATFAEFGVDLAFAPNTFGTIFGPVGAGSSGGAGSLVKRTMDWSQSFQGGTAPTNLDGIEVRVQGKAAPIAFLGHGNDFQRTFDQINFIAPDLDPVPLGPGVTIEVFKDGALVGSDTVSMDTVSPALFTFGVKDNTTYLAAAQANFEAYIAPTDLFSVSEINGIPIRPTRSGEIISLFGTGFGPTQPPVPAGTITPGIADLTNDIAVRIGGLPALVRYRGLAPNLTSVYQFNVVVPTLSNGNHAVEIDIRGKRTQASAFVPVQNP